MTTDNKARAMRIGTSDNDGGSTMPIAYRQPVSAIRVRGGLALLEGCAP